MKYKRVNASFAHAKHLGWSLAVDLTDVDGLTIPD
jgi:hypothetical protein